MKKKLLLIDAYSIICRGFYALPLLSTGDGYHTNALLGFLNILFRTLDDEKPDYIAVAFDEHAPTFRHKLYKEYKGQRGPMPDELKEQVPYVKDVLKAMGISIFSKEGFEADDILGTLANKFSDKEVEAVILSGDKDMLQLATDKIKIRLAKTVKTNSEIYPYYAKDVEKEYNMTPEEFIDYKAIMGDSSDNYKGAPGVGPKTASELILKYKNIDGIYKNISEIKKASVVKSFTENKDYIYLCKKLATIVTNVNLGKINLEDLKVMDLFSDKAYDEVRKYELKSLYKKFGKTKSGDNEKKLVKTTTSKKRTNENVGATLFDYLDDTNLDEVFNKDIKTYEESEDISFNLKERYKKEDKTDIFEKYLPKEKIDDLSVMAYIIDPTAKDYDYIKNTEPKKTYKDLLLKLEKTKQKKIYDDIDYPLISVIYNMEKIGVGVDEKFLNEYGKTLDKEIKNLTKTIYKCAGEEFNINSPKQLSEILFNKLKLDYDRKKGEKLSTGVEVLEKLIDKHEIVKFIMDYRTYTKLKNTYSDALPKYIVNGRIHTNFNQTETATGRLSSDNPNLQNIPIRTELGRELRKAFVPRKGFTFIDADYSQIELRILAILSKDEKLIDAYKGTVDVHTVTASEVFGVPISKVTPELRRKAKAVNFGIVYGISSFGLSEGLHIDQKEAKTYIDKYFDKYKKVKEYLDSVVEKAKVDAYTRTYYGRIRPIREFISGNAMQKAFAKRVAMNSPIQGTASDIMKLAMIGVDNEFTKKGLESRIVLQVHDEILIECKIGEEEKVKKILHEQMTDKFDFPVKLAIEISEGKNWEEAH